MATLRQLKNKCLKLGLLLEEDRAAQEFYVSPPIGYVFEGDTHYYVGAYGWGGAGTRAEAINDLFDRIDTPSPCEVQYCDHCELGE